MKTQEVHSGAHPVMHYDDGVYTCAQCGEVVTTFEQDVTRLTMFDALYEGPGRSVVEFRVSPCGHRLRWLV